MAARANYFSIGPPGIGFAAEARGRQTGPISLDRLAWMRRVRFMAGGPRAVYHLQWQGEPLAGRAVVDSDVAVGWGKFTSDRAAVLGAHLIKH